MTFTNVWIHTEYKRCSRVNYCLFWSSHLCCQCLLICTAIYCVHTCMVNYWSGLAPALMEKASPPSSPITIPQSIHAPIVFCSSSTSLGHMIIIVQSMEQEETLVSSNKSYWKLDIVQYWPNWLYTKMWGMLSGSASLSRIKSDAIVSPCEKFYDVKWMSSHYSERLHCIGFYCRELLIQL